LGTPSTDVRPNPIAHSFGITLWSTALPWLNT
jgi:hypothetical protein